MKLVEILANELKAWPGRTEIIVQDADGKCWPSNRGFNPGFEDGSWSSDISDATTFYVKLAIDHTTAIVTRADWEAERAKLKAPKANGDGWVRNRGRSNKSPVDDGVTCTVKFRDGSEATGKVGNLRWLHSGVAFDVMRYKIHKPAEQPVRSEIVDQLQEQCAGLVESAESLKEAGPLEWRDRIRELDTQRAEVESGYQRQISEIAQERESLVQKLAGEGLALVEVVVQPVGDISDPANWRKGDLITFVEEVSDRCFTTGKQYIFEELDGYGTVGVLADDEGDENGWAVEFFKWHSRPAS
jgi:hypothetical protein